MSSRKASRSGMQPTRRRPRQAALVRPSSALASARDVGSLVERIVAILGEARARVVRTVNSTMVLAYWHVGREIVEFVQRGARRAEYGEQVLEALSARLQARVGRGYSVRTSGTSAASTRRTRTANHRFGTRTANSARASCRIPGGADRILEQAETYLPSVEELERELEREWRLVEAIVGSRAARTSSRAKGRRR